MKGNGGGHGQAQRNKATIAELGLEVRTYNALRRAGYNLVEELVRCSDQDLLNIRNVGKTNLNEIRSALGMPIKQTDFLFSSWSLDQQKRQSEAYDLLARIENKVRRFIRHYLQQCYGKSWWASGIPEPIKRYVGRRMTSMSLQPSFADPLEFVDFGDYRNIITSDASWSNVFSTILGSKNEIEEHLVRVNRLRRSIAHTRPIESRAFDRLCREARFTEKTFRIKRSSLPIV